jgi:hypothetical protein
VLPRFGSALLLLWFIVLICAFSAFASRVEAEEALDSWYSTEPQELPAAGALKSAGSIFPDDNNLAIGGSSALVDSDGAPQDNYFGSEEVGLNSADRSVEALQDAERGFQMNTQTSTLDIPNNIYDQHPGLTSAAQERADLNEAYYMIRLNGPDPSFISRQEGFRLDAYVPDPGLSSSGATIGTGVDIGQLSVADIEALDIPQGLKQRLEPYAGLTGLDAVYFLNGHPLHLTEDEANALNRVIIRKTIDGVAYRYNTAGSGQSFTELPPEAQTIIADIAFQYGANLAQRMPNFWSDVTEGRWKSVVQKLRNFGDRYPTRHNAEADLLEREIDGAALGGYVVAQGDTLSKISSQLGTSMETLAARNDITDPDVIYTGQVLYY